MSTNVIKEGNVTTTIMDLTNGVGGRSAEVLRGEGVVGSFSLFSLSSVFTY